MDNLKQLSGVCYAFTNKVGKLQRKTSERQDCSLDISATNIVLRCGLTSFFLRIKPSLVSSPICVGK